MKKVNWLGQGAALLLFIAVPLAIGFTGSFLTSDQVDGWYASADQAPWTPPNVVFGPVWTLLYVMIGVAGWLLWRSTATHQRRRAFILYGIQLVLNAVWSPLFFGAYPTYGVAALWVALAVIYLLLLTIMVSIKIFAPISKIAGWLFVPYGLWVAYASTLNLYMALHN
ncbi:TspO/MBR family protein [Rothia endophytica]|uniref:TspO/MBR family protein n=1 Tax=Rothia endophytica TaxID=1324766 RepID=UPI001F2BD6CC|nr:TspO/MBR family protein [Rothia endophytica]